MQIKQVGMSGYEVTVFADPLHCEVYQFSWIDFRTQFHYVSYSKQSRPTKRHRFHRDQFWSWWDHRESTIAIPPEPTEEIMQLVKDCFTSSIHFTIETEKK